MLHAHFWQALLRACLLCLREALLLSLTITLWSRLKVCVPYFAVEIAPVVYVPSKTRIISMSGVVYHVNLTGNLADSTKAHRKPRKKICFVWFV